MSNTSAQSLLDLLRDVSKLPQYLQADAVKSIVSEWRRVNPLVDEVANGHTSFEEAISALVDENRRLTYFNSDNACNSPRFVELAKETSEKFSGVLPLSSLYFAGRAPVYRDLVTTVDVRGTLSSSVLFCLLLGMAFGLVFWAMASFMDGELKRWWDTAILCGGAFGLFMTTIGLLVGHPAYIGERRYLANLTLRRAKFLDSMFKLRSA